MLSHFLWLFIAWYYGLVGTRYLGILVLMREYCLCTTIFTNFKLGFLKFFYVHFSTFSTFQLFIWCTHLSHYVFHQVCTSFVFLKKTQHSTKPCFIVAIHQLFKCLLKFLAFLPPWEKIDWSMTNLFMR